MSTNEYTPILLAGGKGTRLSSVVNGVPKPLAPINETPFISFILEQLMASGFNEAVLATGYKHESFVQILGNKYKHLKLIYSVETEALGTGGAVKKACQKINTENVLIMNGDSILKENSILQLAESFARGYEYIVCNQINANTRYGSVKIQKGTNLVEEFQTKPSKYSSNSIINAGIYFCTKESFLGFKDDYFSLEEDYLKLMTARGKLKAIVRCSSFIDIGIPEDYIKAQTFIGNMQ